MAQTTEVRKIVVKAEGEGIEILKGISKQFGELNKSAKATSQSISSLSKVTGFFLAMTASNRIFEMSDGIQSLNAKLSVLHGTQEEANKAFEMLRVSADATNSTMADLGTMYTRFGMSSRRAGISTQQLMDLTVAVRNSFRASGATMAESTATAIQMSQAFSQGTLRGQELRSVMLQNAVAADLLRKKFGDDIFDKAEKGLIDINTVMKVFLEEYKPLEAAASKIKKTFGDTLAKAMDEASININKVTAATGAVDIFAVVVIGLAKNLDILAVAMIGVFGPAMVARVVAMNAALNLNPIILASTAFIVVLALMFKYMDSLSVMAELTWGVMSLGIEDVLLSFSKGAKAFYDFFNPRESGTTAKMVADREKSVDKYALKLYEAQKKWDALFGGGTRTPVDTNIPGGGLPDKDLGKFYKLNKAFKQGKLTLQEYADALSDVKLKIKDLAFDKGQKTLFDVRAEERARDLNDLTRNFNKGYVSAYAFGKAVEEINMQKLNDDVLEGKINLKEFNAELLKISESMNLMAALQTGAEEYVKSIGTIGQGIADATKSAFKGLEDGLVDFLQKGSMDWKKFSQDIMDDLTRIFVRTQIVGQIARGVSAMDLTGLFGAGLGSGSGLQGAQTPQFPSAIPSAVPFASGGIVNSPTLFNMKSTGLTGESGPEAIIPLRRTSDGSLGVSSSGASSNVVVNIMNNSGAEITQKESTGPGGERTLDILIESKVRNGIARGLFDKQFNMAYGLSRRGV